MADNNKNIALLREYIAPKNENNYRKFTQSLKPIDIIRSMAFDDLSKGRTRAQIMNKYQITRDQYEYIRRIFMRRE